MGPGAAGTAGSVKPGCAAAAVVAAAAAATAAAASGAAPEEDKMERTETSEIIYNRHASVGSKICSPLWKLFLFE